MNGFEVIPPAIFVSKEDVSLQICYANEAFYRLLGYRDREDFDLTNHASAVSAIYRPDLVKVLLALGQVKQGAEHSFSADFRAVTRSHSQKWVHAEGSLMVNNNEERRIVFALYDLERLEREQRRLQQMRNANEMVERLLGGGAARIKFDKQMTLLEVSEGWSQLMKPPGERAGASMLALIPEADRERVYDAFASAYNAGRMLEVCFIKPALPGEQDRLIQIQAGCVGDSEGYPVFSAVFKDITRETEKEKEFESLGQRLRHLNSLLPCGYSLYTLEDNLLIESNSAFQAMTEYQASELAGGAFSRSAFMKAEEAERLYRQVSSMRLEDSPVTMECSLFSKSGAELKVRAQISRIEDPQGRSLYQIMEQDVSRERRAEAQCAQLEQKMALMDELTDQPMVRMLLNERMKISGTNPAFVRMSGYAPEELGGMDGFKLFPAEEITRIMQACKQCMQDGQIFEMECRLKKADGIFQPVLMKAKSMILSQGLELFVALTAMAEPEQEQEEGKPSEAPEPEGEQTEMES